jgi:hypothetical protein
MAFEGLIRALTGVSWDICREMITSLSNGTRCSLGFLLSVPATPQCGQIRAREPFVRKNLYSSAIIMADAAIATSFTTAGA